MSHLRPTNIKVMVNDVEYTAYFDKMKRIWLCASIREYPFTIGNGHHEYKFIPVFGPVGVNTKIQTLDNTNRPYFNACKRVLVILREEMRDNGNTNTGFGEDYEF